MRSDKLTTCGPLSPRRSSKEFHLRCFRSLNITSNKPVKSAGLCVQLNKINFHLLAYCGHNSLHIILSSVVLSEESKVYWRKTTTWHLSFLEESTLGSKTDLSKRKYSTKKLAVKNSFSDGQLSPFNSSISTTREQLTIWLQTHVCHSLCSVFEEIHPFAMFFWITL